MALGNLWSRAKGLAGVPVPANELEAELRRATDCDGLDPPRDALLAVRQASHNEDDRRQIMRHLHFCLAEQTAARWRRIYNGLVVVEELLKQGDPALVTETSEGAHFDLVQRLTFLGRYEYTDDTRVQGMVRRKADAMRATWIQRQMELEGLASGTSGAARPSPAPSAAASAQEGKKSAARKPNFGGVGNLVSMGHNDDSTDDDSDEDKLAAQRQRQQGKHARSHEKRHGRHLEDLSTTDDADSSCGSSPQQPSASTGVGQAPVTDLLDFDGGSTQTREVFQGGSNDLLGGFEETARKPKSAVPPPPPSPQAVCYDLI